MHQPKWSVLVLVAVLLQLSPCVAAGIDLRPLGAKAKDFLDAHDVGRPAVREPMKARIPGSDRGMARASGARHAALQAKRYCQHAIAPDAERDLAILRITLARHLDYASSPGDLVLLKGLVEASGCANAN